MLAVAGCATAPQDPADPLDTLNSAFRSAYAHARTSSLAEGQPYLVVAFDTVFLHADGQVKSAAYTPELYHQYKKVAHAVLTTFCLVHTCADPLTDADVTRIEGFLRNLDAARDHLPADGFPASELERQRRILAGSASYLRAVLQARRADPAARDAALRALEPDVMANVAAAARVQLDDLNRAVTSVTKDLAAAQRRTIHVVVTGTHQARDRHLQMAYFRKALGEPGPAEDRLVFCELEFSHGARTEDRAEQLLGTHLLDEAAAASIFGDRSRLQYDILGDEAARYVQAIDVPALR